ncbi:hypothetical protein MASR2M29_05530 [Spirochaetota bacterium]
MKKSYFYPFAAALLLLALAFASCSSPFFGSAKSAKVSLRLNLPDKPESNIPEGILRDLADITSHNSPGSRFIHPDGNWLELEIRQGNKILYSIAKDITANKTELQIDPIILPVKTKLNLKVRFYEKTGQVNEILLGSADSDLYLEDKEFSEIVVGIKPIGEFYEEGDLVDPDMKVFDFIVSAGPSDYQSFYILSFPVDMGDGIYKMNLDLTSTGHFDSIVLYTADGTKHKGAIFGDKLDLAPDPVSNQSPEKELYFGLKGPENKCYVLLQALEDFEYGAINIFLTKLEDELLVVAEKTSENSSWTDPYIFCSSLKLSDKYNFVKTPTP